MSEKWKKCLHRNGVCGALLTDFSKGSDCLPHSLLIAKLHAYGFHKTCTEYFQNYLSYLKRKIKFNSTFSYFTNILNGATQGSIVSTTFQCLSCNLFLFIPSTDLVSYADDNTSFVMGSSELEVINEIKTATESLLGGFRITL